MSDVPTEPDAEFEEHRRLYERNRDDLAKLRISNAENFDKLILTYSRGRPRAFTQFSEGLYPDQSCGRPVGALRLMGLFHRCDSARHRVLVLSLRDLDIQHDRSERYYFNREEGALTEKTWWNVCANHINHWIPASAFCVAIVLTIIFVSLNLRGANVASKSSTPAIAQDGITGAAMQKVTVPKTAVEGRPSDLATQSAEVNSSASPALTKPTPASAPK